MNSIKEAKKEVNYLLDNGANIEATDFNPSKWCASSMRVSPSRLMVFVAEVEVGG